jgi:hypothetical protein
MPPKSVEFNKFTPTYQNHLFPLCRAEHWRFFREQPIRGAARMPHFARSTGMCFLANPDKTVRAQDEAASGLPFLWILSFGNAKESISPVGARTHIKKPVAVATPYK